LSSAFWDASRCPAASVSGCCGRSWSASWPRFVGSAIAAGLGVQNTSGVDWIEWLIQIGLAALGIAAVDNRRLNRR